MIEFKRVSLGYGGTPVLRDISCSIKKGENVGLVGPNGSGKTTFLKGLLNLIRPTTGNILVDRSRRFAYVPQVDDINLLWPLTVEQVCALPYRSKHFFGSLTSREKKNVRTALKQTSMERLAKKLFSELSGGQRQRVILAQALAQNPDILFLDEPTRGLDITVEKKFLTLVKRLQKQHKLTVLFVTHSLHIPLTFSQKIFLFKDGGMVTATPKQLKKSHQLETLFRRKR